jgi:hypothetical protein
MKLSDYSNPISGKKEDLFNLGNLWEQILGVVVFVVIFIFGIKIAEWVFPPSATINGQAVTNTRNVY